MKRTLRQHWQHGVNRFEGFAPRERLLLTAAVAGALFFGMDFLAFASHRELAAGLLAREESAATAIERGRSEKSVFEGLAARDPLAPLRNDLSQLTAINVELDQRLAELAAGLVPPRELAPMLQSLLAQTDQVSLLAVTTLPEVAIDLGAPGETPPAPAVEAAAGAQAGSPKLFRHGVKIHLQGTFRSALEYIRALETAPWHLYWESLDYRVDHYPLANITLNVYTLAQAEGLWNE